jgi:hypothetical protein
MGCHCIILTGIKDDFRVKISGEVERLNTPIGSRSGSGKLRHKCLGICRLGFGVLSEGQLKTFLYIKQSFNGSFLQYRALYSSPDTPKMAETQSFSLLCLENPLLGGTACYTPFLN